MSLFELLMLLVAVAGALRILSQKWGVPHPSLLVLGGLAVALTPGLPHANMDPELMFVIFVPPLLYWGALTISLREMRTFLGPILRLGTGLVIVTMAAVAAIVHLLAPQVGWPAAFVLGAGARPNRSTVPSKAAAPAPQSTGRCDGDFRTRSAASSCSSPRRERSEATSCATCNVNRTCAICS
jgi:hypothetical protein